MKLPRAIAQCGWILASVFGTSLLFVLNSCSNRQAAVKPSIAFNLPTIEVLPPEGGDVITVKTVRGEKFEASQRTLQFSGYEWHVRNVGSNRGGRENIYESANAWTDRIDVTKESRQA